MSPYIPDIPDGDDSGLLVLPETLSAEADY